MRHLPVLLLVVSLACIAFGYWGLETAGGRRAFDEMAGIIPVGVGALGVVLFTIAAIVWVWRKVNAD